MSEEMKKRIEGIHNAFLDGIRAPSHNTAEVLELMIPMRDGIRLKTYIHRPSGQGPWPLLFTRTPYAGMEPMNAAIGEEFARRGFAFLHQFSRGTGGSEGVWEPNIHERDDGLDALDWVVHQDWCGPVGIHGVSYMALTGWILADRLPEKVKGLFLCHYGIDRHLSAYKDGLFRHDILTGWALGNAGRKMDGDWREAYLAACRHRPHLEADEAVWGVRLDWYRDWITQTDYDSPYWQTGFWSLLRGIAPQVCVPVCVVAGWFDHHLEGTVLGYERLGAEAKAHSRLVVGAWNHDFEPCVPGHAQAHAARNMHREMFDWFDGLLVRGELPEPGVETYRVGADRWTHGTEWPIPSVGTATFLFTDVESDVPGTRWLLPAGASVAQPEPAVIHWSYDPDDPVPSRGGETMFVTGSERGSRIQDAPGARADVVSFMSPPLMEDLVITGRFGVWLNVASDCEDTCFTAKVMEVLPDGNAVNIRNGITTLAYRNGSASRMTYAPGTTVEIVIRTLAVDWLIPKGSRLRVDVSSSNYPEYAAHPNVPGVWSLQDQVRVARQTLRVGGAHPARVEIPLGAP